MKNKRELHDEVQTIISQYGLGAHSAVEMIDSGQLSFEDWSDRMIIGHDLFKTPEHKLRLIWIWDSLRHDPVLNSVFQDLSPAGMCWNRNSEPFLVLNRGSWLVLGLQQELAGVLLSKRNRPQEEKVAFQLLDDLFMRPGRNDHLECSECRCLLQLRPEEVYTTDREKDILGVGDEQIKSLGKGIIQIEVPSINQAYTIASRRLEPHRRSHTGNIYEHVVYVADQGRYLLEEIRRAVELGKWVFPSPPRQKTEDHPLFPEEST